MVVTVGLIVKSAALTLVPNATPPEEELYHSIILSVEIAAIFKEEPAQTEAGVTDTVLDITGNGFTVTLVALRKVLLQPVALINVPA